MLFLQEKKETKTTKISTILKGYEFSQLSYAEPGRKKSHWNRSTTLQYLL